MRPCERPGCVSMAFEGESLCAVHRNPGKQARPCRACGGSGERWKGRICEHCGGSGFAAQKRSLPRLPKKEPEA